MKWSDLFGVSPALSVILTLISGPAAPPAAAQRSSSVSLSQKAYDEADRLFQQVASTHYVHNHLAISKQVAFSDTGSCDVDSNCSGFVGHVLEKIARPQYDVIHQLQPKSHFPRAKAYATFFNSLPDREALQGWLKVSRYADLRQGDIVAWQKPLKPGERGNSGHVMFVVDKPATPQLIDGKKFVLIHVLDCSSVKHFPPETMPPNTNQTNRDGLGKGYIRLLLDDSDKPIGYWEGTYSGERNAAINHPTLSDNISFGRLVSEP